MILDLRSDTVTKPTQEMRAAMACAVVGDDVYGDDPTVLQLEHIAAQITGKEAALYVVSGTMGNQIAVMAHTNRGDEIVLEHNSHIRKYEQGGAALLSSCSYYAVYSKNGDGILDPAQIEGAIRDFNDIHLPRTGLICLENATTCGCVQPLEVMKEIHQIATKNNLPVHLDGARLFNAALYLKCDPKELTQYTDSVMFCLSKGLGAPVGSMLCGSKEFINKARRCRKVLGGGMRQAGIIAAGGIYALQNNISRLKDDHENAQYLAKELEKLGFTVQNPHINMLFFDCAGIINNQTLVDSLALRGILCGTYGTSQIRFVTNLGADFSKCEYAIEAVKACLPSKSAK